MIELFPHIEPYKHGKLDVGDQNQIYWEASGNPKGKPALMVHGGPGQGSSPSMRRAFDPDKYHIILFDQRGCGQSTPHASDPAADMRVNTTDHLVADMERLRSFLGIERWLLCGGSWGSTLVLVYAERYPERVSEIVLSSITTGRRAESDWLYRGVARFFPEEYQRFREGLPEEERHGDIVLAYAKRLEHPDRQVREQAALAWCRWEDAVVSLEPNANPTAYSNQPLDDLIAFVRICAHYMAHGAWLEEGAVLRDAARLAGIPGVLLHGRLDLSCPLDTAWELAKAWPDATLFALADTGHQRSASKRKYLLEALNKFAGR